MAETTDAVDAGRLGETNVRILKPQPSALDSKVLIIFADIPSMRLKLGEDSAILG